MAMGSHREIQLKLHPSRFFSQGRVFRYPMAQTAGFYATSQRHRGLALLRGTRPGSHVHQKDRYCVVVREGGGSCTVLLIVTYSGRSLYKPSIDKSKHGQVYTKTLVLPPANFREQIQKSAIRVDPDEKYFTLDADSYINYETVWTVPHDVEVERFGMVHPHSLDDLIRQFVFVYFMSSPSADKLLHCAREISAQAQETKFTTEPSRSRQDSPTKSRLTGTSDKSSSSGARNHFNDRMSERNGHRTGRAQITAGPSRVRESPATVTEPTKRTMSVSPPRTNVSASSPLPLSKTVKSDDALAITRPSMQ